MLHQNQYIFIAKGKLHTYSLKIKNGDADKRVGGEMIKHYISAHTIKVRVGFCEILTQIILLDNSARPTKKQNKTQQNETKQNKTNKKTCLRTNFAEIYCHIFTSKAIHLHTICFFTNHFIETIWCNVRLFWPKWKQRIYFHIKPLIIVTYDSWVLPRHPPPSVLICNTFHNLFHGSKRAKSFKIHLGSYLCSELNLFYLYTPGIESILHVITLWALIIFRIIFIEVYLISTTH